MTYVPSNKIKPFREKHTPSECPIIGVSNPTWVVDHDHTSGLIRGVISSEANAYLGRVENAYKRLSPTAKRSKDLPNMLRSMANYIEQDAMPYLHPTGCIQLCSRFKGLTKADQVFALKAMGYVQSEVSACSNSQQRTKLYQRKLKKTII